MKVVYLDQNHWIALSQAAHGRASQTETSRVLNILRQARASGHACFPLSSAHYIEAWKQRNPDRRSRFATFVGELSRGMTVTPPPAVICHEIEMALERCFPGRVVPASFEFLGVGLAHATADRNLVVPLEWPPGADAMPASLREAIEEPLRVMAELSLLSGVCLVGDRLEVGPATNLTAERHFRESLDRWRGAASQYPPDELEREIYDSNLSDIDGLLREALARHGISLDEFAQRSELCGRAFLDAMPFQKADMHLKRQWAKNASLRPRDSDLIDWAFLSVAVSYCDIVVTENQMAHLFSHGFDTRATVIAQLGQLPELVA